MKLPITLFSFFFVLLLSNCAGQKNFSDEKKTEQIIAELTSKKVKQEKNETGDYLLIQEEKDLTSAFFKYWIFDLQSYKIIEKGSITKGEISWINPYQIKIIRYQEVMQLNEPSKNKEEIINLRKTKQ